MSNIFIWCTSLVNFIIGVNVMYCFDHPEVGLWRIPVLMIATVAFDCLTAFSASIAKS